MTDSNKQHSTTQIVVRDRRAPYHYTIQNIVMDEWRPLIGSIGLDIYNLLCRFAMWRDNERSSISYTVFQRFLGHSRATIWTYLRLLELCELIYRETPGSVDIVKNGKRTKKRVNNTPNNYYILEPQKVSSEFLENLKTAIRKEDGMDDNFKSSFVESANTWKSFDMAFGSSRPRASITPVVDQPSLFGDSSDDDSLPAPQVSIITKRMFNRISILDEKTIAEFAHLEPSVILAVIWHGRTEQWINPDRFSGYVIKTLRKGTIPPHGFIYLAEKWLNMTRNERHAFAMNNWPYIKTYRESQVAHELDVSETVATSILALIKSQSFSSFQNWINIS